MTTEVCVTLNDVNSSMVSVITGRIFREEATSDKTFDLVKWIQDRKLQWFGHLDFGHILWMGPERMVKQVIFEMYPNGCTTPHKQEILY